MNPYEQKRAERIERMRARALDLRTEADGRFETARKIGDMIPFGQPILVGHHSERRHRRDLDRIDANMRKAVEAAKEAAQLDRRADAAESNRAVSSDDPEAAAKLRAKVAELEAVCAKMVAANKLVRRKAPASEIAAVLGCDEATAAKLYEPDFCGRLGFAPFEMTNARAEIRRVRARLEEIERRASAPAPEPIALGDVRIEEADNRVRVFFPGKPDDATRTALKSRGFRWSPTVGAWQRHASPGAWFDAKAIVDAKGGA